jgi:hypothetical protein
MVYFTLTQFIKIHSIAKQNYKNKNLQKERQKSYKKENNTWDSNVVPHRSTNQARTCLTSLSRREAVLSCWYGRSLLDP